MDADGSFNLRTQPIGSYVAGALRRAAPRCGGLWSLCRALRRAVPCYGCALRPAPWPMLCPALCPAVPCCALLCPARCSSASTHRGLRCERRCASVHAPAPPTPRPSLPPNPRRRRGARGGGAGGHDGSAAQAGPAPRAPAGAPGHCVDAAQQVGGAGRRRGAEAGDRLDAGGAGWQQSTGCLHGVRPPSSGGGRRCASRAQPPSPPPRLWHAQLPAGT